jgi:hypothetical protein
MYRNLFYFPDLLIFQQKRPKRYPPWNSDFGTGFIKWTTGQGARKRRKAAQAA